MVVSNFEMEVGCCNVKSAGTVSSGTSGCCLSCCVSCERRVNLIDGCNVFVAVRFATYPGNEFGDFTSLSCRQGCYSVPT